MVFVAPGFIWLASFIVLGLLGTIRAAIDGHRQMVTAMTAFAFVLFFATLLMWLGLSI